MEPKGSLQFSQEFTIRSLAQATWIPTTPYFIQSHFNTTQITYRLILHVSHAFSLPNELQVPLTNVNYVTHPSH